MSWMSLLCTTYDNLAKALPEDRRGLLPLGHSTQKAHVTVTLDISGNFIRAEYVADKAGDKSNLSETLVPVFEESSSRSSGIAPHPLCDKLQYVAGDYKQFTGLDNTEYYEKYISLLEKWAKSEYTTPKVTAIYRYLKKGCIITDLAECGILSLDQDLKLTKKWNNCKEKLTIGDQSDAFIRFSVIGDGNITDVWQDFALQQAFILYYKSVTENKDMCYVTGNIERCSVNHPSKIRNSGDKAKLISSNDLSGFTFRGRFEDADQAVKIGYETSQKAHNALKYLIRKQGERLGDKVFVLWGTLLEDTPSLTDDSFDIMSGGDEYEASTGLAETQKVFADRFNKAISGYKSNINFDTRFAIIGIDAATIGRMSVVYYREYVGKQASNLIDRIKSWHETAAWLHSFRFKDKKRITFYGAPSPYDIALCAIGNEQGDFIGGDAKLIANCAERLLPCISDGAKLPKDIVMSLVRKCFSPQNYNNINNWNKVLSITCSMFRKYLYDYKGVTVTMEIDKEINDISYNCGRLLAVADAIEKYAMSLNGEAGTRQTNAMRYFARFTRIPCETWGYISEKLIPFENKLGGKGTHLYKLREEISASIPPMEFAKARNLDGRLALGFSSQQKAIFDDNMLRSKNKNNTNDNVTEE